MWIKRRWQWIPAITVLCFLTVDLLPHILLLPFHGFHIQNCIFCLKFLTLNFLINIVLSIFSFYQILWFLFQHASTSGRPRENEHESFQNSNNTLQERVCGQSHILQSQLILSCSLKAIISKWKCLKHNFHSSYYTSPIFSYFPLFKYPLRIKYEAMLVGKTNILKT